MSREEKDEKNRQEREKHKLIKDQVNRRRRELYRQKIQNEEYKKHTRERSKQWKLNNPEKYKISHKKSDKKRRENKKVYEYQKKRKKENPVLRVRETLHVRLREHLKSKTLRKSESKAKILGADKPTIMKHLERQFKKGMTWENYGKNGWHIDHIIPLSSAKTEEDVIRLFHYTNLQPMWAEDNIRKGNKIPQVQTKLPI